jgi:hypothetical protein
MTINGSHTAVLMRFPHGLEAPELSHYNAPVGKIAEMR